MEKPRYTIIVVEDTRTIMTAIINALSVKFNIITAYSSSEFMEKKHLPHDLTLMDYNLDNNCLGRDLIAVAESPVIILTSQCDNDTELKCLRAGAVDYMRKPFHPEVLMHRVSMHIDIVTTRKVLEQFSFEDKLTQIKNRRALERDLDIMVQINNRDKSSAGGAYMLLDIDYFKRVNDDYGHDVGDIVLRTFASILTSTCKRVTDNVYRVGGEEFVVLVNSCTAQQALNLAELIRRSVEKFPMEIPNTVIYKTVSIGLVHFSWDQCKQDILYKESDNLLYQAKDSGRNLVRHSTL